MVLGRWFPFMNHQCKIFSWKISANKIELSKDQFYNLSLSEILKAYHNKFHALRYEKYNEVLSFPRPPPTNINSMICNPIQMLM